METAPLFVHCCHCRWCQRETGASFALNAMIEADRVDAARGRARAGRHAVGERQGPEDRALPALPHRALEPLRRRRRRASRFVRVGTLDDPDRLPPDIHIFTASKQPWVVLPPGTPAVPEYYDREQHWPAESLARREALLARQPP